MNNKGMSIVEIIVSVALVSIVLIFMINLLITVKSSSDTSQNKSDALINRALIVKEIEKDFVDYELNGVYSCNTNSITGGVRAILPSTAKNIYCLRFTFNNITDSGYLIQYVDNNKSIIGYKRGSNQIVRESAYPMNPSDNNSRGSIESSCSSNSYENCAIKIVMPIKDEENNNYSIKLTYIYKRNNFTYSNINSNGFVSY